MLSLVAAATADYSTLDEIAAVAVVVVVAHNTDFHDMHL